MGVDEAGVRGQRKVALGLCGSLVGAVRAGGHVVVGSVLLAMREGQRREEEDYEAEHRGAGEGG
jgi:hypothetical protein